MSAAMMMTTRRRTGKYRSGAACVGSAAGRELALRADLLRAVTGLAGVQRRLAAIPAVAGTRRAVSTAGGGAVSAVEAQDARVIAGSSARDGRGRPQVRRDRRRGGRRGGLGPEIGPLRCRQAFGVVARYALGDIGLRRSPPGLRQRGQPGISPRRPGGRLVECGPPGRLVLGGCDHEDGSFSPGADCGGFSFIQEKSSAWLSPAVSGVLGNAASNGAAGGLRGRLVPLADVTCGSGAASQPALAPQLTPRSTFVSGSAGWS